MRTLIALSALAMLFGTPALAQHGTPSPASRGPVDPGETSAPGQANASGCDRNVAVAPGPTASPSDRTGSVAGCQPREPSHPVAPGKGSGAARQ
ncbi:MAG: hypothetical protein K2Y56_09410 [Methylobacterium sp.]|uniref:hypothetical protein n=1 Tax=Methylobacterium sp. TaxID=409 RepID=UPI0025E4E1F4|nr:hypothetical protein [Methylobacterium sp.]MBX9931738.1 hypothetical protein [Methylobacterium sp.]